MSNRESDLNLIKTQDDWEALQKKLGFKTPLSNIMDPAPNISDGKCERTEEISEEFQKLIESYYREYKSLSLPERARFFNYILTDEEKKYVLALILRDANNPQPRRLMLGAGKHIPKQEGDVFLDIRPFDNIDVVHDLNVTPWPFDDNTFQHINATHVVEHLKDLISFMDEAWRVLKPGCSIYIETPEAGANPDLEFCDPTHIRCYRLYTFPNYFSPEGIHDFGYTQKAWCMLKAEAKDGILYIHASTIKQ